MKHPIYYLAFMMAIFSPTVAESSLLTKPFNGYVNKAVSNTIVQKLKTMGFAANDPIYGITLAAAETTIAVATVGGSVAATVGAVGSAPVWLSVALGLGAAYEIYDFAMGRYDYHAIPSTPSFQVTSGTISVALAPPPAPVSPINTDPFPLPTDWSDPGIGVRVAYPSNMKFCATYSVAYGNEPVPTNPVRRASSGTVCGDGQAEVQQQAYSYFMNGYVGFNRTSPSGFFTYSMLALSQIAQSGPTKISCTINSLNCPEGIGYTHTKNYNMTYRTVDHRVTPNSISDLTTTASYTYVIFNNPSYVDPARAYSLNDAVSKLDATDLNSRADPALLAALANKIWQQAAQQVGYAGAPYDAANPVTEANVLADLAAGLYPHPTVADLLTLISPNAQTAPSLDPAAVPVEATNPATTVNVDFGPNPGIQQPTLETTPTGTAIVAQVMGLLPSLSGFTMPAHTSTCSAPTFTFFNSTQTMQPMCDLLEQQRVLLSTIFSAMWGVVSLAMVLKA